MVRSAPVEAINKLLEFSLLPAATGVEEARALSEGPRWSKGATPSGNAAWNLWAFKFLKDRALESHLRAA